MGSCTIKNTETQFPNNNHIKSIGIQRTVIYFCAEAPSASKSHQFTQKCGFPCTRTSFQKASSGERVGQAPDIYRPALSCVRIKKAMGTSSRFFQRSSSQQFFAKLLCQAVRCRKIHLIRIQPLPILPQQSGSFQRFVGRTSSIPRTALSKSSSKREVPLLHPHTMGRKSKLLRKSAEAGYPAIHSSGNCV